MEHTYETRPLHYTKSAMKWQNDNNVIICQHDVTINYFNAIAFLFSCLDNGPSFISISSLVLQLRKFLFIRDLTRNLQIKISPISGDWSEWAIPNLYWTSLMKSYYMLQSSEVITFRNTNRASHPLPLPGLDLKQMYGRIITVIKCVIIIYSGRTINA